MKSLPAAMIDFSSYEESTDCQAKIRSASAFSNDVMRELFETDPTRHPQMFSTKLREKLRFRPGEVTCWAGFNGHRKSMFLAQLCIDLSVQRQRGLVISPEMLPESTLIRMCRQSSAMAKPTRAWVESFMSWSDDRLWLFDHMGRLTTERTLGACRYFREQLGGQYVVIDSMMMICRSEEDLDEQKGFITGLVRMAQETGLHIHLVAHCRKPNDGDESRFPNRYMIRGSSSITDQLQNVVLVWANKAKADMARLGHIPEEWANKPDAVIIVDKQRNGSFEGKISMFFDEASMRFVDNRTSPVEPYALSR